jgi:Prokaryotic Cytochrome C oxidase subunit IV
VIRRFWSAPAAVWLILCLLSVVAVVQLEEGGSRRTASLLVVVLAAIKARLIIRHYMEADRARAAWRILYNAWDFAVASTLGIGYWMSIR